VNGSQLESQVQKLAIIGMLSRGLQPMFSADVFGHATPRPDIADELLHKLGKPRCKTRHHKK